MEDSQISKSGNNKEIRFEIEPYLFKDVDKERVI